MKKNNASPIVGLAGGIGSGKSTVTKLFNALGIQSVDADDVAREVVLPGSKCLSKIIDRFGANILLSDGQLDRRALREIVFKDKNERLWLESITHPEIRQLISTQLEKATSSYVLLVHPLLFETKQDQICQLTVGIDVPTSLQIERIITRDNMDNALAESIISTQLSNAERLSLTDMTLKNDSNLVDLNDKVMELHKRILDRLEKRE
ncbi:dephospho-CoA kinase [Marinomonas sp. TI.3.20]|uniref:dephospho-CoA kinase n=1 Tax=Marinomonas sp. TI.3.20 TaxID=3121296 RepID=UPI00311E214E